MNIAEKLKDAPIGTKLYSPIFGEVELNEVNSIFIDVKHDGLIGRFYSDGKYTKNGECMLFPSRDNRDWNNFSICPFKKGDFIVKESIDGTKFIAIFSHFGGFCEYTTNYLCLLKPDGKFKPSPDFGIGNVQEARLATDSEKKELLDAIERNGYTWNSDTLTVEEIHKYNIYSLKPFDKVLIRDYDEGTWTADFYSYYVKNASYPFRCVGTQFKQCIPYNDETKHLLGTKKKCPKYYKTW